MPGLGDWLVWMGGEPVGWDQDFGWEAEMTITVLVLGHRITSV